MANDSGWLTGIRQKTSRAALDKCKVTIKRECVLRVNTTHDGEQVEVISQNGSAYFDEVIMACHSDKTLD
ncbi:hypothetical protein [Polynucleobacter necessarius]|uniref:hypothetical protein n=1 Tax=Polynucleobacter necessarius TaxID=576610 RepID=UPI0018D57F31|nr:hypothetical protein [Polynucleobacter necessarius]